MLESLIPLHPKLVHFPIALFVSALIFDLLSFITKKESLHKTALSMYVFAAFLTPVVIRTGIWEVERISLNHPILDKHKQFASYTMWLSLMSLPILWVVKKEFSKLFRPIFFLLLLGVVSCVGITGHEGGTMVYEYGVGIEE
ncbi:hypothetical protein MNBD_UNCLBAC01-2147 [hydrothermal vent metagenome]|uniref:DUF2231 domain-containing protein n=1 Tax=hydrothermal vent metagenome TaxID=652676 RepID=A0A3B1CXY9_9ZZZZ